MATFSDLQSRLRNDVLAESDTGFYSNGDLLTFLTEASVEIASLGRFPVVTVSGSGFTSGTAQVAFLTIPKIGAVKEATYAGFPLEEVNDLPTIRLYQNKSGPTRYFYYDPSSPETAQVVKFAPKFHTSGTVEVTYVADLSSTSYTGGDEVWNGALEDWHDAVLYLAGVKAYERGYEYEKAEYWNQRLERRLQPLAVYLDDKSVLDVVERKAS